METYRGIVRKSDIDHMGHMNVTYYMQKFDEATWAFFAELGMGASWMSENRRGMMAVEQHIKYYAEVVAGERLVISTNVVDASKQTIRILHTMVNPATDTVVATCEMVGVSVDLDSRSATPLTSEVRAVAETLRE